MVAMIIVVQNEHAERVRQRLLKNQANLARPMMLEGDPPRLDEDARMAYSAVIVP